MLLVRVSRKCDSFSAILARTSLVVFSGLSRLSSREPIRLRVKLHSFHTHLVALHFHYESKIRVDSAIYVYNAIPMVSGLPGFHAWTVPALDSSPPTVSYV